MKTLFRILIVLLFCIALIYFFTSDSSYELKPLEGPNSKSTVIPKTEIPKGDEDASPRPESGVSTYIHQDDDKLLKDFGKPDRIDQSAFGYEWWVYNRDPKSFAMFGVEGGKITQVYAAGKAVDVAPYKIGQSLDDIYRMTIVNPEITVKIGDNVYTFALTEYDMNSRILVKFDGVFAQLYIDQFTDSLIGIRFMDGETLVKHRPYEMTFVGDLIRVPNLNSYTIQQSNEGYSKQLFDLVNVFRSNENVPPLIWDEVAGVAAMKHSEEMYTEKYLSHDSPNYGSLKDRLAHYSVTYDEVGENLATAYFDAIEAAHGWFNSEEHRRLMLNDKFTHVGSGVFINYYTQIFLNKP
ncbi:CAP domain-containing protein [Ureibacillus sp. FSL K6-8385]|uniref:CAP domain-containing protein n=1 Tax=Ureibacillus sp. FSL K6-8385 TaxID=2954684 RepID=UPI0031584FEC